MKKSENILENMFRMMPNPLHLLVIIFNYMLKVQKYPDNWSFKSQNEHEYNMLYVRASLKPSLTLILDTFAYWKTHEKCIESTLNCFRRRFFSPRQSRNKFGTLTSKQTFQLPFQELSSCNSTEKNHLKWCSSRREMCTIFCEILSLDHSLFPSISKNHQTRTVNVEQPTKFTEGVILVLFI